MAMTADSSLNNLSPRSPVVSADGDTSPQFRRSNLVSPWAQVVRGEPEAMSAVSRSPASSSSSPPPIDTPEQTIFSDCSTSKGPSPSTSPDNFSPTESQLENSNGDVGRPVRPAWKTPLNGTTEVGSVMGGAVTWPALSESTRPSPKPPADCSKPLPDESISVTQGPVISQSPQKQVNSNANPSFTSNHKLPARQRSTKRGGGSADSTRRNFTHPPPPPPLRPPPPPPSLPPQFPLFRMPYGSLVPPVADFPPRPPPYKGYNRETRPIGGFLSQSHAGNSSQRGNYGPWPRRDVQHHNKHGGGKHDLGNDWNGAQSYNVRDVHGLIPPRGFMMRSPPPVSTHLVMPQPMIPYGNPMEFDMTSPYLYMATEPFRGVPYTHPPHPAMFFPHVDTDLPTLLVNQIDYYFSDANLVNDNYLKSNMDDHGWVPVTLIARFPRVQLLTSNIQLILDSLRASTIVEVQGDKLRRRNEWNRQVPNVQFPADSGSQSPVVSNYNMLATSFQKITLDEVTTKHQ